MLGRQRVPTNASVLPIARGLQLPPRAGRASWKVCAASAGADMCLQREALVTQILQDPSLPGIQAAVLQAARCLADSRDWQQLQAVFAAATAPQHKPPAAAGDSSARASSGGGWGFALRQPGQPRPAAATNAAPPQQPASQQSWDWQRVQHFHLLGLGSITALTAAQPHPQGSLQQLPPPSRLGFRLMQLTLAVAVVQHVLPGLGSKPVAFDPEFEPEDVELLKGLGFAVPISQPSHTAAGPTLLYMPCCPRDLYSDVLAANWAQMQQLAVLGTSMSSLSNTQSLFTALVAESDGPPQGVNSSQPTGNDSSPSRQPQPRGQQPQQSDMVSLAYKQGRVVETPCPDCGAHGVGVSLHMLR